MTENGDDTRAPLSLEEVAQAVLDLSAERTLEGFAARFLENLRRWAAPSAVLAAVRDPSAASGWKLLPALCAGSGPLGAERSVRQMIDDVPQDLARPSLVRPGNEVPGVRVRENCVVPWSCEGESGVLMLRGVVHPPPPNLADAVALLCAPVWPRLLGGPAARVEASVAELRRLADQLGDDADRQVERLQAARPPAVEAPPEEPVAAGRVADMEKQLTAARGEVARLLEERRAAVDAEAAARKGLAAVRQEIAEAGSIVARNIREREELQQQVTTLEKALGEVEDERNTIRGEADRLPDLEQQLTAARGEVARLLEERRAAVYAEAEAREGLAAARKEIAEAGSIVARNIGECEELRQQVAALEKALGDVEDERNLIRGEASRLAHELQASRAAGASEAATGSTAEAAPGSSETVEVLRRVLAVLRRTPFLPPPLRVAVQEAEAAVGEKDERPGRWLRLAVLDRDTAGLEPLAAELESAGMDVKIASHPEELALLLKTPQGRDLDAVICDVLAFRVDQTVAGIFRGWEKDRPGLALYLSFSRDSPPEVERAQRVPRPLTRGRLQRPLNRTELMEMLEPLRRPTP